MEHQNTVWITPLRNWHEKSLGQRTVLSDPVWWSWRQRGSKEKSRCGSEVKSLWGCRTSSVWCSSLCCCWCTPVKMFLWQLETQIGLSLSENLRDPAWPSIWNSVMRVLTQSWRTLWVLRWWQIMSTDLSKRHSSLNRFFPLYSLYRYFFSTFIQNNLHLLAITICLYIFSSCILGKQSHNLSIITMAKDSWRTC